MDLRRPISIPLPVLLRYLKIFVGLLFVVGLGLVVWFLHDNVYAPLTEASTIADLQGTVASVVVEKNDLARVLADLRRRQSPLPSLTTLNDPFTTPSATSTPPTGRPNIPPSIP